MADRTREIADDPGLVLDLARSPTCTIVKIAKKFRTRVNLLIHSGGGDGGKCREWESLLKDINSRGVETAAYVPVCAESAGARIFMQCGNRHVTPQTRVFFHVAAHRFDSLEEAQHAQYRLGGSSDDLRLVGARKRAAYLMHPPEQDPHRELITSLAQGESEAHHRLRRRIATIIGDPGLPRDDLTITGKELHELGEVELVPDATALQALFISGTGEDGREVWNEFERMMRANP